MRAWAFLLSGLIVWAVHFFGIYIFASIFLDTVLARVLTLILTLSCLAADGLLLRATLAAERQRDAFAGWMARLATLGVGISFVAVFWQGFPALLA